MISSPSNFDAAAQNYDTQLNQGLRLTGENKEYFAHQRVTFIRALLGNNLPKDSRVLDYGCGIGTATPFLNSELKPATLVGCDLSKESVAKAQETHGESAVFCNLDKIKSLAPFDLVYCNGVFHHIAPEKRLLVAGQIASLIRPGGWFALWENNPWNPMTRLIMSRVPFDQDAIMLWPNETHSLLRKAEFSTMVTRYLFIFPAFLKCFRFMEYYLSVFPIGGQYVVLARRPF
jgi:trans-aconitate methyltransferase